MGVIPFPFDHFFFCFFAAGAWRECQQGTGLGGVYHFESLMAVGWMKLNVLWSENAHFDVVKRVAI
jgi:hypothetical protein